MSVVGDPTRRVTYGELVEGRRIERHLQDVKVKPVTQFSVVGKDAPRKDGRLKVTGAAKFSADFVPARHPPRLSSCVLRPTGPRCCPWMSRGRRRCTGVKVIQKGELVAVLHARPDVAREALSRVKAKYQPSPSTLDDQTIFDHLLKAAPSAKELVAKGSLPIGEASSAQVLEATYLNSYVAHAPWSLTRRWPNGRRAS